MKDGGKAEEKQKVKEGTGVIEKEERKETKWRRKKIVTEKEKRET